MGWRVKLRRFVHLAFAGVFVRHYEMLLWLWGLGGGVDEVLKAITIIFTKGLRWDGPSWRCTSGVNLQPDYRFDFASAAVNM